MVTINSTLNYDVIRQRQLGLSRALLQLASGAKEKDIKGAAAAGLTMIDTMSALVARTISLDEESAEMHDMVRLVIGQRDEQAEATKAALELLEEVARFLSSLGTDEARAIWSKHDEALSMLNLAFDDDDDDQVEEDDPDLPSTRAIARMDRAG